SSSRHRICISAASIASMSRALGLVAYHHCEMRFVETIIEHEAASAMTPTSGLRQSRRFDDLLACGGQTGQRQRRFRFGRRRMQRRFLEPVVELATAAVAWARWGWRLAFRAVHRTGDLDMKMLGVTIPGTHLVKPGAISSGLAAQRLLDRGID